jgi:hypothetical protein
MALAPLPPEEKGVEVAPHYLEVVEVVQEQ